MHRMAWTQKALKVSKEPEQRGADPTLTTGPAEWSAKTMARSWTLRADGHRDTGKEDQREEEQGGQLDSDVDLLIEASK